MRVVFESGYLDFSVAWMFKKEKCELMAISMNDQSSEHCLARVTYNTRNKYNYQVDGLRASFLQVHGYV
jgi:hypothetical protein